MCKSFEDCFKCEKNDCKKSMPLRNKKSEVVEKTTLTAEKYKKRQALRESLERVGGINDIT